MPETYGTPEQGSFGIDHTLGAFVTPEAPAEPPSELRRTVIEPGIEAGRLAQQAARAERLRDPEPANATRADQGYNDERAEPAPPEVVTSGYAPLLKRVVRGDEDIALQRSIIQGMQRASDERERARMNQEDRQRALGHVAKLRVITDPRGSRAHRAALRQAALIEDEVRRTMPPPDISRGA